MQAIITRHLNPTNSRGARIKATCAAGSITIDYPHELTHDEPHKLAAGMLCAKLVKAGAGRLWGAPMVCGQLPSGDWVHVFKGD